MATAPVHASTASQCASALSAAEQESIEDSAHRISWLETPEAKTEALVKEMNALPPEQAQALLKAVLDHGGREAFSAVHVNQLLDAGVISADELRSFGDNVAALYNCGELDQGDMAQFLSATPAGQTGLGGAYTNPDAALRGAEQFFGASSSMAFKQFTESLASDALQSIHGEAAGDYEKDLATTVIAAYDATGRADAFLEAYAANNADEREHILDNMGQGGWMHAVGGTANVPADGLGTLLQALGRKPGLGEQFYVGSLPVSTSGHTKWDDLAVQAVRFAADHPEHFMNQPIGGTQTPLDSRTDALGALFVGHDKAVLDAYTDAYQQPLDSQQTLTDKFVLGNLLALTANNPDNTYSVAADASMDRYVDGLFEDINGSGAGAINAVDRLQIALPAKLLSAGIVGMDTLAGKAALADFAGDAAKVALTFGTAYVGLPAALAGIPGATGAWSVARGGAGTAGASSFRDFIFDALVGGDAQVLEKVLAGTTQMLADSVQRAVDDPELARALRNDLVGDFQQIVDALRGDDFSRFRDALEHD
jgi:hypothetical protein